MAKFRLEDVIQRYVATTSVGPSTVRRRPKGTAAAARRFLNEIDLRQFGVRRRSLFSRRLDAATRALARRLPSGARQWGLARKILSIFLHNAFYNHYLRVRYQLDRAEPHFELPLDSAVARGLRKRADRGCLPSWPGLHRLTADQNRTYQDFATEVAAELRTSRVHLDALLWVQER